MTLSRWRRIATGIAAGVIVLCAALLGASFRSDTAGVSVASELRPSVIIPIEDDPVDGADDADVATDDIAADDVATDDNDDQVASVETSADTEADTAIDDTETAPDDAAAASTDEDAPLTEPVPVGPAADDEADDASADDTADDTADSADEEPAEPAAEEPAAPTAPLTSSDDNLGTGGGVDDAECALDRLVIYAGARRGGVAGSIRAALSQAGFGAGCPAPVTVLASNCPLQFAGVLGAGSGYDPTQSYVAASSSVDRETMTAVMGTVGYSGSQIDILDFSFVNADQPGEQWMAIFVPPSFTGWENLASRAGLAPTTQSLCAASGELAG